MAEVEDYADFGSHFLDSMLEVEMTVEDGEVNVPQPEDPLGNENAAFELPPTPTFDLQSESFGSYNTTIYRNPMAASAAIQPSGPMLTIHSRDIMSPNVLSNPQLMQGGKIVAQKIITPGKVVTAPKLIAGTNNLVSPTFQQVLSKPVTKPAIAIKTPTSSAPKIINASGTVSTTPTGAATPVSITKSEFLNFIFKPEFVKSVFEKPEAPRDIASVLVDEMNYYRSAFRDVQNVRFCRLHCTICDRHLGCGSDVEDKVTVHSMLKVLVCKACYEFYGDGNFPCDAVDNCEIYCRWCGQGGALVCCSFCPRVFCKKCVRRNYGLNFLKAIEKANDWACFCCAQKPLWPHRAICRALMEYIVLRKKTQTLPKKDISSCCDLTPKKKKIPSKPSPTPSPSPLSTPNQQQNSVTIIGGGSDPTKKLILPKVVNNNNYSMIAKKSEPNKNQISPVRIVNTIQNPNLKNNILRNYNTLGGTKNFSPQNIQAPVIHGQTLITPPASRQPMKSTPPQGAKPITPQKSKPPLLAPRPGGLGGKPTPQGGPKQKPPLVMVSLSNQTNAVDLSKIPTAKIPQNVQGLILRMNFPDNKVQLVRLVTEGNGCNGGKTFPMPEFNKKSDSEFLEAQLENSFKLTKILYDRLMVIKDKVSSKTKITEESVYNSSVKKLHMIYEKTSELLKDLNNELLKGFEDWKNEKSGGGSGVDVIDLSDEEKSTKNNRLSNFDEKTKELLQNADSDIEILDDDEGDKSNDLANGEGEDSVDPPRSRSRASSNNDSNSTPGELKEKYGLKDLSVTISKLPAKRKGEKRTKKTDAEDDDIYESKTDVDESDGESDDQNPKKRTKVDDGKTDEHENVENNGDYDMSTETEDNVADDSGEIENHSDKVRENNDESLADEEREQEQNVAEDKNNEDSAVGEEDNEGIKGNDDSVDGHKNNDDSADGHKDDDNIEVNSSDKVNESANEHNYSAMEVSESNENSQDISNNENDELDNEKGDDATEE